MERIDPCCLADRQIDATNSRDNAERLLLMKIVRYSWKLQD